MQAQKAGKITMKAVNDFVAQFNATIPLDENRIVKNRNRYYLLSKKLKEQVPKGFFYAGTYLGAVKGASFFPSFLLLAMIAETKANKLVIDKKTAWLFICGRDVFKKGILKSNNLKKGDVTLILNEHNECLGFGKMMLNLRAEIDLNKAAVKNILDIGDFLRREKRQPRRQQSSIKPFKPSRK
jgi:ribosome biogenesis protein Nip4